MKPKKMTDSEFQAYSGIDQFDYFWCTGCGMWVKGEEHEDHGTSYCDDCYPTVLRINNSAAYYETDELTLQGK